MRFRHLILLVCSVLLTGCAGDPPPDPPPARAHAPTAGPSRTPTPTRTPELRVDISTIRNRHVALELQQELEIVTVTGLADPATEREINRLLREKPEHVLDSWQDTLADAHLPQSSDLPRTTRLRSEATIGLRGPRLLSVRYTFDANGAQLRRLPAMARVLITIDLTTGRRLDTGDLLAPRVRTPEGARALGRVLARSGPHGQLCDTELPNVRRLRPADFVSEDPKTATVQLFPDSHEVGFTLPLWKLGYPMACSPQVIRVGYDELEGFLSSRLSER